VVWASEERVAGEPDGTANTERRVWPSYGYVSPLNHVCAQIHSVCSSLVGPQPLFIFTSSTHGVR
jgi:hypothetical protein